MSAPMVDAWRILERGRDTSVLEITCPYCGLLHTHGGDGGPGAGDGHRGAHCTAPGSKAGYVLREVGPREGRTPIRRPRAVRRTGWRKPRSISNGVRARILERDHFRCRRCGAAARDGVRLVVDHVVPVARGGGGEDENLQTLCEPCNCGKGARAPHPNDLTSTNVERIRLAPPEWPIGLWVLTGPPREWQGQVKTIARNGALVVELFSWIDGRKTHDRLVALAEAHLESWRFFDNEEEWREASARDAERQLTAAAAEYDAQHPRPQFRESR